MGLGKRKIRVIKLKSLNVDVIDLTALIIDIVAKKRFEALRVSEKEAI